MKLTAFFISLLSLQNFSLNNILVHANYKVTVLEYGILVKNDTIFLNMDKIKLKRKSHNEPHKFYGEFTLFRNITIHDDIKFLAELYKKQGGEYRKTAYHLKQPACELIDTDKVLYPSMAEVTGMTSKCPVLAGTYDLSKGWFPNIEHFPPILASGDYMFEGRLYDGDQMLQGWQIYGSCINIHGGYIGLR